ncbi:putative ABC transporter permease [Gorillibacterium sp. sgz5001074]|uniref:putative ABC transporter permease n=1 Tax=Gorillibacterium sp. sgz5001074 TaxID=3446695 RepID=UPI003F67EB07
MDSWWSLGSLLPAETLLRYDDVEALIFYFLLYSFAGLLLENTYNAALGGSFRKANFLQGPYKPMYGIAPVTLLLLTGPETGFWTRAVLCLTVPTVVEYLSGVMLKELFHRTYWDYSHFRHQLHGHICVPYSLCWLGLCLVFLYVLHPYAASFYYWLEPVWHRVWLLPASWFLGDAAYTVGTSLRHPPVAAE